MCGVEDLSGHEVKAEKNEMVWTCEKDRGR